MAAKPTRKKIFKIVAILIGILLVSLIGFHFWFKAHAKQMIENLVESKSNGTLKMKVGKFKFGYFSRNMELEKVSFYNTDTINATTAYRFDVKKIKLRVKGLMAIVFQDQFLIDTLTLIEPDIQVTRLKRSDKKDKPKTNDVSIPEEMGKIYKSIQDALSVLKVSKFSILNGKFTLVNKIQSNQQPVTIGNLDFHIDNFLIDTNLNKNKNKILFSDNVRLSTHNQNITLPDSRHRLSFKDFRIDLNRKLVEFDSCTIAATRTDSSASAFDVFFDKLKLTNIDFDTLYKAEVIKADSVYCVNPKFNLKVEITKKAGKEKTPPKLENIIKRLTGDLLLDNVIVTNADFNIETVKDGVPSSFTFSNNNFAMQGLTIDQEAEKPLKVKRFVMAIRNYENFIKDSSYSIKFDSILFSDDRISLSNFLFEKLDNGKKVNSFSIPQFYLGGLSWDDLVFERKLKADQATMFYPNIIYTVNPDQRISGQKNIFQSLGVVNDFMDLNFLEVVDGNIDLTIKKDLHLKLYRANLSIESNSLLSSKKIAALKNSLTSINFENGKLLAGYLTIELDKLRYIGSSGHFVAENIFVTDKEKKQEFVIKDVIVDKMIVDELTGNIDADGITWKKGTVNLNLNNIEKGEAKSYTLLKNIAGKNTTINIKKGDLTIASFINNINLDKLESQPRKPILLIGLKAIGQQMKISTSHSDFSIANFRIIDNKASVLNKPNFNFNTGKTSLYFSASSMSFVPDIQQLLKNDFLFGNMIIDNPVINIQLDTLASVKRTVLPSIKLNSLRLNQPAIDFSYKNSNTNSFKWNGSLSSSAFLNLTDINIDEGNDNATIIKEAKINLSDFEFTKNGKLFTSGKATISATANNIGLSFPGNQTINWDAFIHNLKAKDLYFDHLGKAEETLLLESTDIDKLFISSSSIADYKKILSENKEYQISNFTGNYKNAETQIDWKNASFNRTINRFFLNSFSYQPALARDSFLTRQEFQKDYITFKTGAVEINDINPDLYLKDDLLKASSVKIKDPVFTDYKDKQIPFNSGLIKPMPVNLLKKISFHISVQNVEVENGNVEYVETGIKPNSPAVIQVTRLNIQLKNTKNYNFQLADTLYIDATGHLLDTALAHLNIKESYNDANGGFLLSFQVSPIDATIINPVLTSLASVKLESGFLDTLYATVTGREAVATGEINMLYRDLKIKLPGGFKTFLANTFVIKKNNKSKSSQIFHIRNRDRSAINYYVKIIGSGVASSIGAKNNKKLLRKYQKKLKKRNLSPL